MPVVTELIEGQEYHQTGESETYTVPVKIEGIFRETGFPQSTVITRAAAILDSYNPPYAMFRPHPKVAGTTFSASGSPGNNGPKRPGFLLVERAVKPFLDAQDKALAILTYRNFNYMKITVDGNVLRTTTRYDVNGELLAVGFEPEQNPKFDATNDEDGTSDIDFAEPPVLRPLLVLGFEYVMSFPQQWSKTLQGRVNKEAWQKGPAHTWLCTQFGSTPLDNWGRSIFSYVKAEFQFLGFKGPSGFTESYDPLLIYTRRDTGKPASAINPKSGGFPKTKFGNGFAQYQVQFEADFAPLNLPSVFFQ